MDLDDIDRALLRLLREDARRSMRDLASLTGVSTPTASAKVKALESLGVIRGYRALLDPRVTGHTTHVLEVEARPAHARALAERIAALEGVEEALELAGGVLHVRFLAAGAQELQRLLDALHGMPEVRTYRVHTVLSERALAASAPEPATIAVPCHECKGPIHGSGVRKRWEEDGSRDHWFCCRNCAATFEAKLRRAAGGARRRHADGQGSARGSVPS